MRACLFEDRGVENLEPLTLTRPAFELLCGQDSLGSKQYRYFTCSEVGVLLRPYLAPLYRLLHPHAPVNDLAWLRAETTIFINGRWLPPVSPRFCSHSDDRATVNEPCVALIGDEVAYAVVGTDHLAEYSPNTLDACLEMWKNTLPRRTAGGCLIRYPWDLIERNGEQLIEDYELAAKRSSPGGPEPIALVGPADRLLIDRTARLEPMIVADTTRGPVTVGREAVITAFTRLEGPAYIGPRTHVLGAKIRAGTTLGPNCRVGGEVEASIIHGNTNKYHDGFLGHSYVGEWVNFGAGTQNSDLRNDYGEVTVAVRGRPVATGLSKVGCFVGDHTKTGLGALLNTGSSIGVFCNLLPSGKLLPKYFPSFTSCWNGRLAANAGLPQLLQTAREVMRRRGVTFTEAHAATFRHLFDVSAAEREGVLSSIDRWPLPRSA